MQTENVKVSQQLTKSLSVHNSTKTIPYSPAPDESTKNKTNENDISEIMEKYEIIRKSNKSEVIGSLGLFDKIKGESPVPKGIFNIGGDGDSPGRDCSVIESPSMDHSTFVGDFNNKDMDVVLCISNIEMEEGFYNNKKNNMEILHSEERLISTKDKFGKEIDMCNLSFSGFDHGNIDRKDKSQKKNQNDINSTTVTEKANYQTKVKRRNKFIRLFLGISLFVFISIIVFVFIKV
jgi:hypothetical protein